MYARVAKIASAAVFAVIVDGAGNFNRLSVGEENLNLLSTFLLALIFKRAARVQVRASRPVRI